MSSVAEVHPEAYVRNGRGLLALQAVLCGRGGRGSIHVVCLVGPTGSGKSKFVWDHFPADDIYTLIEPNGPSVWFDGYVNQAVLLMDDFNGQRTIPGIQVLLKLLDRYPMTLQVKGGTTQKHWTMVYITSNLDVGQWYPSANDVHIEALRRRISSSFTFPQDIDAAEQDCHDGLTQVLDQDGREVALEEPNYEAETREEVDSMQRLIDEIVIDE